MAKKAKKRGKRHHRVSHAPKRRRHRISGVKMSANNETSLIIAGVGAVLGFVMGDKINAQIDKVVKPDKADPKLVALGQIAPGTAWLLLKKGRKNMIVTGATAVLAGAGIKRGAAALGLGGLGGYQNVPAVGGYQNVNAVNGQGRRRINMSGYNPMPGGMSLNGQGTTNTLRRMAASMNGTGSGVSDR